MNGLRGMSRSRPTRGPDPSRRASGGAASRGAAAAAALRKRQHASGFFRRAPRGPANTIGAIVIERSEVLAVARLARLELSEEEVEPMARELSTVLDHIATIGQLDLTGVAPTSHVVDVTGALRPDEPRPCLPREVALAQAPAVSADGFLVPSPQA
jgi:aspartyl-tRNA(Asn)/glutamyl-tRNA(Gln) amidotransferase subunit C